MNKNTMKGLFQQLSRSFQIIAFFVVCLCGASYAYALNDITVRLFGQREILAGNYNVFCQDDEGFIWIGTDAGLIRFDGNHGDVYRNDELNSGSISDNKIVSLFTDSRGMMWVGTLNGMNFYDRKADAFRLVRLPGMQLNGYISDIAELPDGRLLFLVGGIGFYTFDVSAMGQDDSGLEAKRYRFGFNDDSAISRLIQVAPDHMIFSIRSGEVYSLGPGNRVEKIAKIDSNVSELSLESPSSLIISSQYEVFRLDYEKQTLERLKIGDGATIKVTDLHSAGGVTYLSTAGDGIWEILPGSDVVRRADRLNSSTLDLSSLKIGSVFVDGSGNLWFGCNHKGLAMAPSDKGAFSTKCLNRLLREEGGAELTCLKVIGDDIVVGLNTGKVLFLGADGRVRKVSVSHGGPVTSLCEYPDGKVLVGVARDGIWSVDPSSLGLKRIVNASRPYPGVVLSVGKKGEIVAAFGELGVLRYNPATHDEKWFYPVGGSNLLSCFYYAGIHTAADGKIWIGGYSGIACYDPEADSLIPIDQKPFMKGVVNDICDCSDGVMIATDRGLLQYSSENGALRKFSVLDGLPDNDIRTLERDGNGGIWIGTMNGVAYLKDHDSKIRAYGGNFGQSGTAYVFSDQLPSHSDIVMGNFENIVMFNPDSVRKSDFGGAVNITGIYLNGVRLTGESRAGSSLIVEGDMIHPDALHLSHKDNSLVLRLSTLDFRDAADLRYEWQFEGDGDTWHASSPGESAIYLPPLDSGHYILRLRGWENDVASEVTELKLDVKAPWYLSDMAYAVYIIMVLLMGGLVYKVVKNKREEELYEARIRYFMDISHELRSPVTLMLSPVETLLKQKHSPETTSQLLTVRRNAQRVLSLVDQLLDLRKIEKGKMRLVFTPVDIKAFVEELVDMFRPMAEDKGLTLTFSCGEPELWGEADRDNLDKILVNLISNAIKYTPKGGVVNVDLKKDADQAGALRYIVTVTDTGVGLDSKMISHLFERFYRNREYHHGNASGFGIGLDLCMRLVELHKGDISAKNREDGVKGSVFSVTLPLNPVKPGVVINDVESKRRLLPDVVSGTETSGKTVKSGHRFRILVVDDDDELREYIKRNLGPTYKVVTVPDAEAALKELGEKLPDLIVTDIRMDGIDGMALLRRIKANMTTQHIPVILFSAVSGSDERIKGWRSGADGYLAKPFTIDELEGMISGLLSTRSKLKGKFSGTQQTVNNIAAPKVKGVDEDLMDRINRYINDNLSEVAMNVDGLSEYVGLSRSQLHRRMKDVVGVAPSDYIRNVKLRKACEMLSRGDVDIAQVAYSLGFNAQSHFSTLFKRYTGVTPTEYRTRVKEGKPVDISDLNENAADS